MLIVVRGLLGYNQNMPNAGKKIDRLGPNQQKVLLLLLGGAGLSVARTSKQYFRVIAEVKKEWEKINQRALNNALRNLYKSKLVAARDNPDGSVTMVLTDKGRKRAITFNIETMRVKKPKYWDKKWRLVLLTFLNGGKVPARPCVQHLDVWVFANIKRVFLFALIPARMKLIM